MHRSAIIDCAVHHRWHRDAQLLEYMPKSWQEYLGGSNHRHGGRILPLRPTPPFVHPLGPRTAELPPPGEQRKLDGAPCPGTLRAAERVVLVHDDGMSSAALGNHFVATEVARAANEWTMERWLQDDGPYWGTVLVASQTPEAAAEEIRRAGRHPRMVGVLLSANALGKPFGHPVYRPIITAAADLDLVLVIHSGGEALSEATAHATAGGLPMTYSEVRTLAHQSLATHLLSLIGQGTFERFPSLRVLLVGAGAAWVPPVLWRSDNIHFALRSEVPWVKRAPSEYLREHVRVATFPLHASAHGDRQSGFLESVAFAEEVLVYGSGYPDRDADRLEDAVLAVPPRWRDAVFCTNAAQLFWPHERRDRDERTSSSWIAHTDAVV